MTLSLVVSREKILEGAMPHPEMCRTYPPLCKIESSRGRDSRAGHLMGPILGVLFQGHPFRDLALLRDRCACVLFILRPGHENGDPPAAASAQRAGLHLSCFLVLLIT